MSITVFQHFYKFWSILLTIFSSISCHLSAKDITRGVCKASGWTGLDRVSRAQIRATVCSESDVFCVDMHVDAALLAFLSLPVTVRSQSDVFRVDMYVLASSLFLCCFWICRVPVFYSTKSSRVAVHRKYSKWISHKSSRIFTSPSSVRRNRI